MKTILITALLLLAGTAGYGSPRTRLSVRSRPQTFPSAKSLYFQPSGFLNAPNGIEKPIPLQRSGTISRLRVCTTTQQPSSGNLEVVYRVERANTRLRIEFKADEAAGCHTDSLHKLKYVAGDGLSISVINNAVSTSAAIESIDAEFE